MTTDDPIERVRALVQRWRSVDLEDAAKSWEADGLPMTAEATRILEWASHGVADELEPILSDLDLLAERIERYETALRSTVASGEDIADMAGDFISTRDVTSLRNYGSNIASIARYALSLLGESNAPAG